MDKCEFLRKEVFHIFKAYNFGRRDIARPVQIKRRKKFSNS